jgi:hypothetical protein
MPPALYLLDTGASALLDDRCRVAGRESALRYTFGQLAEYAFSVTDAMLCYLMERAAADMLPHAEALAALAAAVATGKPVGNGKDYSDGGQGAALVPVQPRKPSPAGRVKALAQA